MWQDYVIASTVSVFALTTLPLIINRTKVPLWTTIPMILGSLILASVYVTLGLWFSLSVEIIAASLWAVVLVITLRNLPAPHEHSWRAYQSQRGRWSSGGTASQIKWRCECGEIQLEERSGIWTLRELNGEGPA